MGNAKVGAVLTANTAQFTAALAGAQQTTQRFVSQTQAASRQAAASGKQMSGAVFQTASAVQDLQYGWRGVLNNVVGVAQSMPPVAKAALGIAVIGGVIAANWDAIAGRVEGLGQEFFHLQATHKLANLEAEKALRISEQMEETARQQRNQQKSIQEAYQEQLRLAEKRAAANDMEITRAHQLLAAQRQIVAAQLEQQKATGIASAPENARREDEAARQQLALSHLSSLDAAAAVKEQADARERELKILEETLPKIRQAAQIERDKLKAAAPGLLTSREAADLEAERARNAEELAKSQERLVKLDGEKSSETGRAIVSGLRKGAGGLAGAAVTTVYNPEKKDAEVAVQMNAVAGVREKIMERQAEIARRLEAHGAAQGLSGKTSNEELAKSVESQEDLVKQVEKDLRLKREAVAESKKAAAAAEEQAKAAMRVAQAMEAAATAQREQTRSAQMYADIAATTIAAEQRANARERTQEDREVRKMRSQGKHRQADKREAELKEKRAEESYRKMGFNPEQAADMAREDRNLDQDEKGGRTIRSKKPKRREDTDFNSALRPAMRDRFEQRLEVEGKFRQREKEANASREQRSAPARTDTATTPRDILERLDKLIQVTIGNGPTTNERNAPQ